MSTLKRMWCAIGLHDYRMHVCGLLSYFKTARATMTDTAKRLAEIRARYLSKSARQTAEAFHGLHVFESMAWLLDLIAERDARIAKLEASHCDTCMCQDKPRRKLQLEWK